MIERKVEWTPASWYRDARAYASVNAKKIAAMAEYRIRGWKRRMPDLDAKEVFQRIAASNRQRLDAAPDPTRFPEARGMRELVLAQWEGIRDGASLSPEAWAAHCDSGFYVRRHYMMSPAPANSGKCTYVYFADSDEGPLLANNLDSSRDEPFGAPEWPLLNEHLLFGPVSSGIFMDEVSPEIFPLPVLRIVGRYARTVDEAVEILTRYMDFWGPRNALLVDRNHRLAMLEKSARRMGVRYSDTGFGFITSMSAEEPTFRAYLDERRKASLVARGLPDECGDTVYWAEADHRRELLHRLVEEQRKGTPTFEGLRSIIQHRDGDERVCYHNDKLAHGASCAYTLRTTIWKLGKRKALWWAIDGDTPSFKTLPKEEDFPNAMVWD